VATTSGEQPELVTLELPKEAGATSVAVAGEFNSWSVREHEMRRRDDGSFAITLELLPGRTYCYRYWVDGERWENDWSADAYVPNEYGGDNSMIDLRESSPRLRDKTPVAHEPPAVAAPDDRAPAPAKRPAKPKAPARKRAARTAKADPPV
jgi:hypothetical protein